MLFAPQDGQLVERQFEPAGPAAATLSVWPRARDIAEIYWARLCEESRLSEDFRRRCGQERVRSECARLCFVPVLHGPLQRMLGISHPGIARRKDSQPEIERHAKPEPRGVTITLHTTDAPNHYAGPNAVNTEPDQQ